MIPAQDDQKDPEKISEDENTEEVEEIDEDEEELMPAERKAIGPFKPPEKILASREEMGKFENKFRLLFNKTKSKVKKKDIPVEISLKDGISADGKFELVFN